MICFTERKNKQVRCNMEQSYGLINDALYISEGRRLKNLVANSNVFRAQRCNAELCAPNTVKLTGELQTATVHHPAPALTSEPKTAASLYLQATPPVFIADTAFLLLYCTGFAICTLEGEQICGSSPMLPARHAEIRDCKPARGEISM